MRPLLARIPFRESRYFIITCLVVLAGLFAADRAMSKWVEKGEKRLERLQQKRKAEGGSVAPEAYVPVWLNRGMKLNLAVAGAMLLASPWLGRRRRADMRFMDAPEKPPLTRWAVLACAALMGLAAWHNWPRLFHSMWGDEEFNASRFILDEVERQPDGTLKVSHRDWTTTLWNMRKPTNHLAYSVVARLSHDTFFHESTEAHAPWFSEALLRAPVFVSGLLLIPAFIWALRVWGLSPWLGLVLFLIHPWFTRFGVDGRGYGFVLLFTTLLIGIAGRGLQTGRWHWWVSFGLGSFFIFWSNLQSAYLIVGLNLAVVAGLFQMGLKNPGTWLVARRWFVGNIISLMLMVGLLAPCWPQLQEFIAKGEILGVLDGRFWRDSMSAWFFGQPWEPWEEPDNPLRYALQISMQTLPVLHLAGMLLFAALLVAGLVALAWDRRHRGLLLFVIGTPAVMLLHMHQSQVRPYDWYFCPFLPGLFLAMSAGAQWLGARLKNARSGSPMAALRAGAVVLVALYAFITRQPRSLLRNHPIEQSRESVDAYRKVTNPRSPAIDDGVMSGGFRMYTEGYDPAEHRFETVEELKALLAEATRTGRNFYVNVGFLRFLSADAYTKPICDLLLDPAQFEDVGVFHGLLHSTTRHVFRYRGSPR